jgi:hypothetical protein
MRRARYSSMSFGPVALSGMVVGEKNPDEDYSHSLAPFNPGFPNEPCDKGADTRCDTNRQEKRTQYVFSFSLDLTDLSHRDRHPVRPGFAIGSEGVENILAFQLAVDLMIPLRNPNQLHPHPLSSRNPEASWVPEVVVFHCVGQLPFIGLEGSTPGHLGKHNPNGEPCNGLWGTHLISSG